MKRAGDFFRTSIEAATRLGRRAILLTQYREHLPAHLPPGVVSFPYVPFAAVLPRSAAIVHHGGIGTIAQALAAGTPQLIRPMAHDQPDNAARAKRLGVALTVSPDRYSPDQAAHSLRRLLTSQQEVLRTKPDGRLYHREGQELEFKEQFNLSGLAEYFRDFAAFSNNRGGYLVFGVTDTPRVPVGLSESALSQFEKIDPEKVSGFLLDIFSPSIEWEQAAFEVNNASFGVFRIYEAREKPVIARKDEGKKQVIKNGEVYYRYGGRTQKILYAEFESIINARIQQNNQQWLDLVQKIGSAGPSNAAILDTERSLIEKGDAQILVVDDDLAKKIRFVKEGEFKETHGAPTLKLVGDVVPVDKVEVVKRVRENLIREYPLSATELAQAVQAAYPAARQNKIWEAIRDNDVKNNTDYSAYNFRNKKQEDDYKETGKLPKTIPSIYNQRAVDFLVNVLRGSKGDS
ncbi:MAG: RNA-binding domain-containing protein [Vicinamibacteria bacterium]